MILIEVIVETKPIILIVPQVALINESVMENVIDNVTTKIVHMTKMIVKIKALNVHLDVVILDLVMVNVIDNVIIWHVILIEVIVETKPIILIVLQVALINESVMENVTDNVITKIVHMTKMIV